MVSYWLDCSSRKKGSYSLLLISLVGTPCFDVGMLKSVTRYELLRHQYLKYLIGIHSLFVLVTQLYSSLTLLVIYFQILR